MDVEGVEALQADSEVEQRPGDLGALGWLRTRIYVCAAHANPRICYGVLEGLKGEHWLNTSKFQKIGNCTPAPSQYHKLHQVAF